MTIRELKARLDWCSDDTVVWISGPSDELTGNSAVYTAEEALPQEDGPGPDIFVISP